LLYIMTNQHVNELAIYRLHKLKDFSGSNLTCKCCFSKLSEYQKYCRFKIFTSNWVYCKKSWNIFKPIQNHSVYPSFKLFSGQKMYRFYIKAGTNNDYQNIWVFSWATRWYIRIWKFVAWTWKNQTKHKDHPRIM